jgi:hypothetical protein
MREFPSNTKAVSERDRRFRHNEHQDSLTTVRWVSKPGELSRRLAGRRPEAGLPRPPGSTAPPRARAYLAEPRIVPARPWKNSTSGPDSGGSTLRRITRPLRSRTDTTGCLMNVPSHILARPLHESRSLVGSMGLWQFHVPPRGVLSACVGARAARAAQARCRPGLAGDGPRAGTETGAASRRGARRTAEPGAVLPLRAPCDDQSEAERHPGAQDPGELRLLGSALRAEGRDRGAGYAALPPPRARTWSSSASVAWARATWRSPCRSRPSSGDIGPTS